MKINEESLNNLDEKVKKLGLKMTSFSVKPCNDKFLFNKEKNSIILNEKEISDKCNYIASIHMILTLLNPKKTLYFINLADFTPAIILLYLQIISQNHNIIIFCNDFENLQEYQTKELKILNLNKVEKYNLLKRSPSGSNN